jgi:hypothetical protein
MTACVPAGTVAIAGIDLDRVRASPLYTKLPAAVAALAQNYSAAHRLLAAWNGTDLLIVVRGTASGVTAVTPDLGVAGPAGLVQAAIAQYRAGVSGTPALVDASKTVSAGAMWAVAQGGVTLPVEGNARNFNRLFRNLEYAALSVDLGSSVDARLIATGRTEQAAREFEESVRAALSLAMAAESRNAGVAALLASIQVERSGARATAKLHADGAAVDQLGRLF